MATATVEHPASASLVSTTAEAPPRHSKTEPPPFPPTRILAVPPSVSAAGCNRPPAQPPLSLPARRPRPTIDSGQKNHRDLLLSSPDNKSLKLYDLKDDKDTVTVVGYPLRGDTISVTKGVVSRIELHMLMARLICWVFKLMLL